MNDLKRRLLQLHDMCSMFDQAIWTLLRLISYQSILAMMGGYCVGKILDALNPWDQFWIVYYASLFLIIACLTRVNDALIGDTNVKDVAYKLEARISQVTMSRITKFSLGQVTNQNSGFKHDVIKKGESSIVELVQTLIFNFVPSALRVIVAIVGLSVFNLWIGALTLLSILCYIEMSLKLNQKMLPRIRKHSKEETRLGTLYWERIKHLSLIIVSGQEERAMIEQAEDERKFSEEGIDLWRTYIRKVAINREPFAVLGQFVTLILGVYFVRVGGLTVGGLAIVFSWSTSAYSALGTIGSMQRAIMKAKATMGHYFDLIEIPPAITVVENPVRVERLAHSIEFRDVRFQYPVFKGYKDEDGEEIDPKKGSSERGAALNGVSFTIKAGTVTAFVGHSGSGKSTGVNLIMRGYDPDSGSVLVDGHDMRTLDLEHWKKHVVGVVPQDPKLWDQSLEYNMGYCMNSDRSSLTSERLHELSEITQITEFYDRLGTARFKTIIGENGLQLSGGQRQRVALARAIAKSPSLLILDEATNALDPQNEKLVHEAIRRALQGRTGIIIAHRLSTIRNADQIVVFEKGSVVGIGTHRELIRGCDQYKNLVLHEVGSLDV